MNTAPIFDEALAGIKASTLNLDAWPVATDTFYQGKFKDALLAVLNYINADFVKKYANADLSEFAIPHGSLTVYLTIKDNMWKVEAPFLKLPEKGSIPLMRQVAELNFGTLILSQIFARNGELHFEYSAPLELCEPYKVYAVFQEICNNADYYDDFFIEKFGAERLAKMQVQQFTPEQLATANKKFHEYLKEALDYCAFFEDRRLYDYALDALCIGLMKIDYFMAPQGFLRNQIEKSIGDMFAKKSMNELLADAKTNYAKFTAMDEAQLFTSLYIPEVFISAKSRADVQGVQNRMKNDYVRGKDQYAGNDFMGATSTFMFAIYDVLYRYNIPPSLYKIFQNALTQASAKPFKESAEILYNAATLIQDMKLQNSSTPQ